MARKEGSIRRDFLRVSAAGATGLVTVACAPQMIQPPVVQREEAETAAASTGPVVGSRRAP